MQAILKEVQPLLAQWNEAKLEQAKPEHEQQMLMTKLDAENEKQRLIGESEFDRRNKMFVAYALGITILAVTVLACFDKLNDGLLSIFSMLIGSFFTAYASGLQIVGKNKPGKEEHAANE
ncbi:hypothetical protein [Emticicia sp. BO119]|uniref:hypothetical protein n=1 Tax=Emticicia sp. BO119 TaxID=2757768 RepID=UPI0015F06D2B|nr:hypothetical protein [Emticicia sp. BO119]MBA4849506.1 hypothetical protein [Emticicia sp. BO119]